MAEHTKIAWTDHTFNPWLGCSKVDEGCANCYAEALMDGRYGRVRWGPQGTRAKTKTWHDPVKWNRAAAAAGETRKVFCASLADVFEDWRGAIVDSRGQRLCRISEGNYSGLPEYAIWAPPATMNDLRRDLFRLIDATPALSYLLLTKRPLNIKRMWPRDGLPRENVWLGTSIANQAHADQRIDELYLSRGLSPTLFLSVEPQIDHISLRRWLASDERFIDWVIIGGESAQGGAAARPYDIEWARQLVSECREFGVPCFVKQLGSTPYRHDAALYGKPVLIPLPMSTLHGDQPADWPADLRVRECPETYYPELVG